MMTLKYNFLWSINFSWSVFGKKVAVASSIFVSFFFPQMYTHCDGAVFAHSSSDACSGGSVTER